MCVAVSKEKEAAQLRAKAANYRTIARASNDDATANAGFKLAANLEERARDLERTK